MLRSPLLLAAVALAMAPAMTHADSIQLRSSVRVDATAQFLTLGQIAILDGDYAASFSDLVVGEFPAEVRVFELSVREVRDALDREAPHWGRLELNGRHTIVRPARRTAGSAPVDANGAVAISTAPTRPAPALQDASSATHLVDQPNARGAITRWVIRALDTDASLLRLEFPRRAADWVDAPLDDAAIEIAANSSMHSPRLTLAITIWASDGTPQRQKITVKPTVNTPSLIVKREITRGTLISAQDLSIESRWGPPASDNTPSTLAEAVGREAVQRLSPGDIIGARDLRIQHLIKRGEHVIVKCRIGGVVIEMDGVARADGGLGDMIEIRRPHERDSFMARVIETGYVLIDRTTRPRRSS